MVGGYRRPPIRAIVVALAFASGALITALAHDLFGHFFQLGGVLPSGIGLPTGVAVSVVTDTLLDRYYVEGAGSGGSGLAILAAVTLDGVPESAAMGVSILQSSTAGTLALLVAI